MERARVGLLFFLILFLWVNKVVRGSKDAEVGQEKCFCPPSPIVGGGSFSPPDGPGILPPPSGGAASSPAYTSPPYTPSYSSPPPSKGTYPSTPALTPPYTVPSRGGSSSPTTPHRKHPSPSYSAPPSPSSSSSSPTTPSYGVPPSGGRGRSASPTAPSTPSYGTPSSPSTPDGGIPAIGSSPSTPSLPTTPSVPGFSPPGVPSSGTGTCDFWGSHTSSFPDILSIFSSIADLFGGGSSYTPAWGHDMTLRQALTNNRKDGYGSLLREGSAALLNSLVNPSFKFRPHEVKKQFNKALVSNLAAAVQGAKFKAANEGRLLP